VFEAEDFEPAVLFYSLLDSNCSDALSVYPSVLVLHYQYI